MTFIKCKHKINSTLYLSTFCLFSWRLTEVFIKYSLNLLISAILQ